MPAQNAAVEPLPFDPVTTTDMRDSLARSTASASSSSAIRARQTPSPYFGRSNIQSSPIAENVWCQIFRIRSPRPDSSSSRIDGLEFTSMIRDRARFAADIGEQVHGGDAQPERARGLSRQAPERHRSAAPRAPSFRPRSDSSARECPSARPSAARRRAKPRRRPTPAKARGPARPSLCAASRSRIGPHAIAQRRRADIFAPNRPPRRPAGKPGIRDRRRSAGSRPSRNIARLRRDIEPARPRREPLREIAARSQ